MKKLIIFMLSAFKFLARRTPAISDNHMFYWCKGGAFYKTYTIFLLIMIFIFIGFIDAVAQCGFFGIRYSFFNRQDSTFNAHALSCDPCVYGMDGADICRCRYNCEQARDSCAKECIKNFTGFIPLAQCIEQCDLYETYCKNGCGDMPARRREPIVYHYKLILWWNESLVANQDEPPKLIIDSDFILSNPPNNLSIKLPQVWFLDKAHCFLFFIRVFYDDGTCCIFYAHGCFPIG